MLYDNYAMLTKRELLIRLVKLLKENNLVEGVKYIPVDMRPRGERNINCCVHKDRYILKHKIISILGFDIDNEDEDIDLTSLGEYAQRSLDNKNVKENILSVVHEACSACRKSQFFITNICRGCEGRPCMMNCPKGAVSIKGGKAEISQEDCVSCGLCQKVCPYHAVIYTPVPCEHACPVNAITKNPDGTEQIDKELCIYCGRCMQACPFGAIMERSKIIDIHKCISNPANKIVAIVAPAIYGQFDATPGQILAAVKKIGFDEVVEVALGAEETSRREAAELKERIEEGAQFMTSSCCPAYVRLADKHIPTLRPFVSDTRSPMVYAARLAKERYPGAEVVFIGPCLAKRFEAESVPEVDYIMSFEELGAFLAAYNIQVKECDPAEMDVEVTNFSRKYAMAGGVRNAIVNAIGENFTTLSLEGLDKKNITILKAMPKKPQAQFVEVMACEEGCINGPCSLAPLALAKKNMRKVDSLAAPADQANG